MFLGFIITDYFLYVLGSNFTHAICSSFIHTICKKLLHALTLQLFTRFRSPFRYSQSPHMPSEPYVDFGCCCIWYTIHTNVLSGVHTIRAYSHHNPLWYLIELFQMASQALCASAIIFLVHTIKYTALDRVSGHSLGSYIQKGFIKV